MSEGQLLVPILHADDVQAVVGVLGVPEVRVEDRVEEGARIVDVIDVDDNDNGLFFGALQLWAHDASQSTHVAWGGAIAV